MVGAGLTDTQHGWNLSPTDITSTRCHAPVLLLRERSHGADYRCDAGCRNAGRALHPVRRRGQYAKRIVRTATGGLAGSTLSLDAAVRNMVEQAAEDAIHMASLHPARLLGIANQLGSLAPGKRATLSRWTVVYTFSRSGFRVRLSPLALSLCSCWPYETRS
jgi:hypothetical protein